MPEQSGETEMGEDLSGALSKILNSVVSPDDVESLVEKACRTLCSIDGFDRVSVSLFDQEQNGFVERGCCEAKPEASVSYFSRRRVIAHCEESLLGQAVIHSLPYAYGTQGSPPLSEVVVPLCSRENLIGALCVTSDRKEQFKETELEKLVDFGRILSVAIENRILSSSHREVHAQDGLTGLYTQRYLQSRLREEIDRVDRFGGRFSLAIMEVDSFAQFRKKHGYDAANAALVEISRQIVENLREVDVAARYGEKEFAVALPNAGREEAEVTARRIQEIVRNISFPGGNGQEERLSVSVGIAVYPNDNPFTDGLLEAADMALARAKERGNNQICTYAQLAREQGILTTD